MGSMSASKTWAQKNKKTKKGDRNAAVEITPSRHHAPFQKLFPPKRKPRR